MPVRGQGRLVNTAIVRPRIQPVGQPQGNIPKSRLKRFGPEVLKNLGALPQGLPPNEITDAGFAFPNARRPQQALRRCGPWKKILAEK